MRLVTMGNKRIVLYVSFSYLIPFSLALFLHKNKHEGLWLSLPPVGVCECITELGG